MWDPEPPLLVCTAEAALPPPVAVWAPPPLPVTAAGTPDPDPVVTREPWCFPPDSPWLPSREPARRLPPAWRPRGADAPLVRGTAALLPPFVSCCEAPAPGHESRHEAGGERDGYAPPGSKIREGEGRKACA